MRILQLCKKFPFPLKDGESIAITSLGKALSETGCDVSLIAMNTSKHHFEVNKLPEELSFYERIETVEIDNQLNWKDALKNLFSSESYHISRFVSSDFESQLRLHLTKNEYDIIQLETLYLMPYMDVIRKFSDAKVVLRPHNVEHEIWERISSNTKAPIKKWYLNHLTKKLKRFEVDQLNACDLLIPITDKDKQTFNSLGCQVDSVVTPIGLDLGGYQPDYSSYKKPVSIGFIGSLDWQPNIEGLQWFLKDIWSSLSQKYPDIKFHIAGRNTPDWMHQLNDPNIIIEGEVDCAKQFINQHSLMIVPLLSGSGMRAKIIEGMALGKIVVTTKMGLEGIQATNKKEVIIADKLKDFEDGLDFCFSHNGSLKNIGEAARSFVDTNFDTLTFAERLSKSYFSLIKEKSVNLV